MNMGPKLDGSSLKQQSFAWGARDMYTELRNFQMEVNNILMTCNYNINDQGKAQIVKNWLGRKGLYFIQTFTKTGQEAYKCM